jgi:hypothetical protein
VRLQSAARERRWRWPPEVDAALADHRVLPSGGSTTKWHTPAPRKRRRPRPTARRAVRRWVSRNGIERDRLRDDRDRRAQLCQPHGALIDRRERAALVGRRSAATVEQRRPRAPVGADSTAAGLASMFTPSSTPARGARSGRRRRSAPRADLPACCEVRRLRDRLDSSHASAATRRRSRWASEEDPARHPRRPDRLQQQLVEGRTGRSSGCRGSRRGAARRRRRQCESEGKKAAPAECRLDARLAPTPSRRRLPPLKRRCTPRGPNACTISMPTTDRRRLGDVRLEL